MNLDMVDGGMAACDLICYALVGWLHEHFCSATIHKALNENSTFVMCVFLWVCGCVCMCAHLCYSVKVALGCWGASRFVAVPLLFIC